MVKKLLVIILVLPLLGVSCDKQSAGSFLQSQLVDKLKAQWHAAQSRVVNFMAEAGTNFAKNLSAADKQAVEDWLIKNQLNQYGDSQDTAYTGGTPLFDEATGESLNRYEYLLKKFPELQSIIKNATEKK